jgi:hypothetical protein
MLSIVWASLFIADVPDGQVPLRAGSAVVRFAQVGSGANTLAAVTAPDQAQAAGSTAKPQVLYLQSTPVSVTNKVAFFVTHIPISGSGLLV